MGCRRVWVCRFFGRRMMMMRRRTRRTRTRVGEVPVVGERVRVRR